MDLKSLIEQAILIYMMQETEPTKQKSKFTKLLKRFGIAGFLFFLY